MIYFRGQVSRFVILFQGRTGSTWLVSMLNEYPRIWCQGEQFYYLKQDGASAQHEWMRSAISPLLVGRTAAKGFKTKYLDILDPEGFSEILREMSCRVVYLYRRNRVKAVVSVLRASRLRQATDSSNLYDEKHRLDPLRIDPETFHRLLKKREAQDRNLAMYIEKLKIPVHLLTYERLLVNTEIAMGDLFSFLGVRSWAVQGNTLKITSDDLSKDILNFDELRSSYVGTFYQSMFDEIM